MAIMLSAPILKKPLNPNEDIAKLLSQLEIQVSNQNWAKATESSKTLDQAWRSVQKRLQFSSVEFDEMKQFSTELDKLDGSIKAKDKSVAIIQIQVLKNLWHSFDEI